MYRWANHKNFSIFLLTIITIFFPSVLLAAVVYGKATCNGKAIDKFEVLYKNKSPTLVEVKNGSYRIKLERGSYEVKYKKYVKRIRSTSQSRMQNIEFCK